MIPNVTRGGSSFKGAFQYYLHDKGASTRDRVAWTETENMMTNDPDKAWKIMAYTAKEQDRLKEASGQSRAGRKLEKPVFAFSLAWHPEQNPDKDHMLDTARRAIEMLGLSEHEAVIVAHRDEPQKHVHVIVNRVHPITGIAGDIRNSKLKFSDFALEYEREHGKVYCEQREKNHEKRERGENVRYSDPAIADAWANSHCGQSFVDMLEAKGYFLAQGRKRIVIVDPHGKSHNPTRMVDGLRAKDFKARIADLDLSQLPKAESLTAKFKGAELNAQSQREVFEKLARLQVDSLRDRHDNEIDRVTTQYRHRIDTAKVRLARQYDLPAQKKMIQQQIEKTRDPSWWKRLFGIARRDQEYLNDLKLAYRSSHWRYREKLETIRNNREHDLRVIKERQTRERDALLRHFQKQRDSGNYSVKRALEPTQLHNRAQQRNGPSYER
jgi:hypothetical protein